MIERYRPSNGTEGDCFIETFCCHCARSEHLQPNASDLAPAGCPILDLTFAHDIEDPEYPGEWIEDGDGPRCTAFIRHGEPVPTARCSHTPDMFTTFLDKGGST